MSLLTLLNLKLQGRTWKTRDGIRVVVSKQALQVIRK
jgi:hypothetical protein